MKLIQIQAQNYKGFSELDLQLDGKSTVFLVSMVWENPRFWNLSVICFVHGVTV